MGIITKRIEEKSESKLQKELQELKVRHESLLDDYKKLFQENKDLKDTITLLCDMIKKWTTKN